jgi:hypothetical protein
MGFGLSERVQAARPAIIVFLALVASALALDAFTGGLLLEDHESSVLLGAILLSIVLTRVWEGSSSE